MWFAEISTPMSTVFTHKLGGGRENMQCYVMEIENDRDFEPTERCDKTWLAL